MFRRLFGGGKAGEPPLFASTEAAGLHSAITAELLCLDLYRPGLGRTAIHYVATGERREVVTAITANAKATSKFTSPYAKEITALNADTNVALVTGQFEPGAQLARLLEIRIATETVRLPYGASPEPAERMLAGFSEMVFSGLHRTQVQYSIPWDTIIPLRTLFAHMRHVGGTMRDLLVLVTRRDETLYQTAGSWPVSPDFAEYVATYPVAFAEVLRTAHPKHRLAIIKLAERHAVTAAPEVEAVLVAMLAKPFGHGDRDIATSALARLAPEQLLSLLQRELPRTDIDTRYGLIQAAGRSNNPEALAVLAERAKIEKAAKPKAAIEAILEADAAEDARGAGTEPGYAAIDGRFVTLPERKDAGPKGSIPPTAEARTEFAELVEQFEERRRKSYAERAQQVRPPRVPAPPPAPFGLEVIDATFAAMTEGTRLPVGITFDLAYTIQSTEEGRSWFRAVLQRLPIRPALAVMRASANDVEGALVGISHAYRRDNMVGVELLRSWLEEGRQDMRDLASVSHLRTLLTRENNSSYQPAVLWALEQLPRNAVWPWIVENMDLLDEALSLKPSETPIPLDRALQVMAMLPAVPQRYLAKLLDIAVTEKRALRRMARDLVHDGSDLVARIEGLLDDKRQQVRINAAIWLADIRSTASEGGLRKRLKKEKSDPVRAALIESLQRMGADLSDVIGPAMLIAEAEAAQAKAAPELPDWLIAGGLPGLHFRDGSAVPPQLVKHWLALAIRLKDPAASGQFGIYLDQLREEDARALSDRVLDAWIAYDTRTASLDEATAYAIANYQQHFSWLARSAKTPELREQVIAEMIREKTGELLHSGADTKGVLALACRADPVFAANRVRWFLKKHGRRSNQAMALLEVLAGIGRPAALQVVIAASARLKQKSTQARAAEIAERYAEDRGWSFDELADRTVPAAGFDDDGLLELPCGEDGKLYTAQLDAMLAIHLYNPDGKPVKSLPAGDDDATRDSKKLFSGAKKELAQVIALQGTRLFEAMCVERAWGVADWRMAFHEHPVMRRLVERLVWQGVDEAGNPLGLFRPTQEGDFTDAGDGPVDLGGFAKVRLAHGALVDEVTCREWAAHLKDYEVKPFLVQFDTLRAPLTAEQAAAEAIFDRQGWKADSLTFRGVAEKRGYERVIRDGGGCNEYEKKFASHGITATIFHTGSHAVDENNPVALNELRFAKQGHRGPYRLGDVPPIMLAECWADYHAIAAKGSFDPEWEKVAPW